MSKWFFFITLTFPFIIEGLGIRFIRDDIGYYYLFLPIILFFIPERKKEIHWPVWPTLFFGLFIFFSLVSSLFFAVDKQLAFEKTLFYLASYLIFIFFYNQKDRAKKYLSVTVFLGTGIFIVIFLAFKLFFTRWVGNSLITGSEYNFIAALHGEHNHLGDFLGITLIYLLFSFFKTKKRSLLAVFLLVFYFFLISFSRSAYWAFIIVMIMLTFLRNKELIFGFLKLERLIIFFTIIATVCLTVFVSINRHSYYFDKEIKPYLITTLSSRLNYWQQAKDSIVQRPFFGVGPGNFGSLSNHYRQQPNDWTDTAHNIFLQILAENGGLAFVGFALFILIIVVSAVKNFSLYSLLFFYLLFNFQTDYTYQIYSFFIFFMIVTGLIYEEKKPRNNELVYGLLSILITFVLVRILISDAFLMAKLPVPSLHFYPLNKFSYQKLITEEQKRGNYATVMKEAASYEKKFAEEPLTLNFLSRLYENYNEKSTALSLYEKIYSLDPFVSFETIKKIYLLKKEVRSTEEAKRFIKAVLKNYQEKIPSWQREQYYQKQIEEFCQKEKETECEELNWDD